MQVRKSRFVDGQTVVGGLLSPSVKTRAFTNYFHDFSQQRRVIPGPFLRAGGSPSGSRAINSSGRPFAKVSTVNRD